MNLHLKIGLAHEMVQYTVRGVPKEVDRALRTKAAQLKISLNQLLVNELAHATIGHPRKADFSALVGRWTPDPEFDDVIASQRQIDWDKWK